MPLLAFGHYGLALGVILLNRLLDGLDGAVARHRRPTAFGGYLDIVCDMVFYAAVAAGLCPRQAGERRLGGHCCSRPSSAPALRSWGAPSWPPAAASRDTGERGRKSFFHAAGLMEGTETILAFVLFCLLPGLFPWLAGAVAALCFWTAAARVVDDLVFRIEFLIF